MKKRVANHNGHDAEALKEKALKVSITEGTTASISTSIGDNYVIPFAVALGAQPGQANLLSGISGFMYYLSQLFGTKMMEKYSRKKIVMSFVLLQAIMWLFIALTGLLVWKGVFDGYSTWILIAFYSVLLFFGGISYPSWFSWMGDIVPEDKKGEYFGRRTRINAFFGLVALLAAMFFLDYYKTKGIILLAFAVLFALAFTFRFISFLLFHKQYAPQFKAKKKDGFSFISFLKKYDNFGKFAVYQGFFNLAVMFASPLFAVYMLKELGFSYKFYTLTLVSYMIFYLIFLKLAGKFSDRYGNKRLTIVTNVFFALTPILYILIKSPIGIVLLPQLSSGIASAASVISFSNFIYDSVSPKHRAICVTYTNIMIGIGTLVGAILGWAVISYLHPSSISPYIFIFALAALLRTSVALFFLPQIKEVRKVKRLSATYNAFFHPAHYLHAESIKLVHLPERVVGKFKSLKLFSP